MFKASKILMIVWTILCVLLIVACLVAIHEEKAKPPFEQRLDYALLSKEDLIVSGVARVGRIWFGGMVVLGIVALVSKKPHVRNPGT